MQVVFASTNPGKIAEMRRLFVGSIHTVLNPADISPTDLPDVAETGSNYQENALLKAQAYAQILSGLPVFADDSGLEISALDNWPGLYSARIAVSDDQRRNLVLAKLRKRSSRDAKFICELCLLLPGQSPKYFHGEVAGTIAEHLDHDSTHGFGYDPLFVPEGYDQSFGQLTSEIKNSISHRKRAIDQMLLALNKYENNHVRTTG